MSLNNEEIRNLLQACQETHDEEVDCEQFLAHMAAYAEKRAKGEAMPKALEKVDQHQRLCPTCREECEALLEVLEMDLG